MTFRIPSCCLLLTSIALLGCGSDEPAGPPPPPPPPPAVATVTVTVASPAIAGTTVSAAATLRDAQGAVITGRQVDWSSSDPLVATIDQNGLVTAVYPGPVTISAAREGKTGEASLVVDLDPLLIAGRGRIALGDASACGIPANGAAVCWGNNGDGQLGDGTGIAKATPVPVTGGQLFKAVTVGVGHACGLTTAGQAYCWGANWAGQLGNGSTDGSLVPVAVSGGFTWVSISAGFGFTCAVATGGAARCWGENGSGALGDGTAANSSVPVAVAGGLQFASVASTNGDESFFACGLTPAGAAHCWGDNGNGQLGDGGAAGAISRVPVAVSGGHTFRTIGTSDSHACGLTVIGDVYCWGWNHRGQLGDGTTIDRTTPVKVGGGPRFAVLNVGEYVNCGLTVTGSALCWGDNRRGQLGNGAVSESSPTPVAVSGGHRFAVTAQGWNFTCGVTLADKGYCWGWNAGGYLGNGSTTESQVPVPITGWD
jgi:alpha-tubulin suppressor-like RCC1 family protein